MPRPRELTNCMVWNKKVKCANCYLLDRCNSILAYEELRRRRKEEEDKKNCKCFKCEWGHKENMYCPFPRCMKDELDKLKG